MEFASMRYGPCSATGLLVLTLLLSQTSVLAFQPGGSYSANDQCYCYGDLPASLGKRIVPTPVGGKSVEQICERLGSGPGLILRDGVYNFPVYKDPQCGHGPFDEPGVVANPDCLGTLDGTLASCQPAGPVWDLQTAFSNASVVAQPENLPLQPAGAEPVKTLQASPSPRSIGDFKGRVVTIEGQRYLQAKDGIDTTGGDPGSRIILDGKVFLRDDESIDPEDLYRPPVSDKSARASREAAPKAVPATEVQPQVRLAEDSKQIESSASLLSEKLSRERRQRELADVKGISARAELPIDEIARMFLRVERNMHWAEQAAQAADALPEPEAPAAALPSESLPLAPLPGDSFGQARVFSYIEAVPVSFDFGGEGVLLEGTAPKQSPFQFFGQLAVAETHTNVLVGGAFYHAPEKAKRTTVVLSAGIEYGEFELNDDVRAPGETFSITDSGVHASAGMRFALSPRLVLSGGIGYSSYYEGDAHVLGGSHYSITSRLDILSRFRIGDNDLLGIGLRYQY